MMQNIVQKIGNDNAATLCWIAASLLWNIGFIFPAQHKILVHTTNLSRGLGLIILNSIGLYWRQLFTSDSTSKHKNVDKKQLLYVSIRHILLGLYSYGFAQAHFYLPSPVLYTIYFSGPLFVMLLQFLLYNIILTKKQVQGLILTSIGVLLTSNGQIIWAWLINDISFHTKFQNYKTDSLIVKFAVAIGMIILTFGWACAVLLVRKVKGCSHWSLNFNFGYILTIPSAFLYMFHPDQMLTNDPWLFAQCIVKQGLVHAATQAFFMIALLIAKKPGTVTIVGFTSVIFSYLLSIFRYNQPLNIFCTIGSIIALIGISFVVLK